MGRRFLSIVAKVVIDELCSDKYTEVVGEYRVLSYCLVVVLYFCLLYVAVLEGGYSIV